MLRLWRASEGELSVCSQWNLAPWLLCLCGEWISGDEGWNAIQSCDSLLINKEYGVSQSVLLCELQRWILHLPNLSLQNILLHSVFPIPSFCISLRTAWSLLQTVASRSWTVGPSVPCTITPDRALCVGPAESPSRVAASLLWTASFTLNTLCVRSAFGNWVKECLRSRQGSRTVRFVIRNSLCEKQDVSQAKSRF